MSGAQVAKTLNVPITCEINSINEQESFFEVQGYVRFDYDLGEVASKVFPDSHSKREPVPEEPDVCNIDAKEVYNYCPCGYAHECLFSNSVKTKVSGSYFGGKGTILRGAIGYTSTFGTDLDYKDLPLDSYVMILKLQNNPLFKRDNERVVVKANGLLHDSWLFNDFESWATFRGGGLASKWMLGETLSIISVGNEC